MAGGAVLDYFFHLLTHGKRKPSSPNMNLVPIVVLAPRSLLHLSGRSSAVFILYFVVVSVNKIELN